MKRIKFILAFFLFLFVFSANVYAFPMLGFGFVGLSQTVQEQSQTGFLDNALYGITIRYKGFGMLGFIFDILYLDTKYWVPYGMNPTVVYGPWPWNDVNNTIYNPAKIAQDDWEYYHDEFIGMFDLAFFLALGRTISFHFAFGPTYWWATPSDAYKTDDDFKKAYDAWYGKGGFKLGMNFKLGANLVFGLMGITLEYNYIAKSINEFFGRVFGDDPNPNDKDYYGMDYLKRMGYLEFGIILWL
ncbi:MAG: DUF3300 domain-containing protein [Spirochaetes bacterium]|nr:DUF3300 domain-containing protein [Spirochaetota bacterium]